MNRRIITLLFILFAVAGLIGCASTPTDQYVQSEKTFQSFTRAYIAAVKSKSVTNPTVIRAGREIIREWNSANAELNIARLAGDTANETFWLNRVESILVRASQLNLVDK